jgi:hypothetical protein
MNRLWGRPAAATAKKLSPKKSMTTWLSFVPVVMLVLGFAVGGASVSAGGHDLPTRSNTKAQAQKNFAARYATTFSALLLPWPLGGEPSPFPALTPADFRLVETTNSFGVFSYEAPAGPAIRARVSRQNGWVEFDSVTVSAE